MTRLFRWCVPDGVWWTRWDRIVVDAEYIGALRWAAHYHLAAAERSIAEYRARWAA